MSDTTYVDYTVPAVNAEWLNEINDHVWHDTPVVGTTVHDASLVGFNPTGIGASATTVQVALDKFNHLQTGLHYVDEGARIDRLADRVFIGDAVKASGINTAIQGDWLTAYQLSTGRTNGFIQIAQAAVLNDSNDSSTVTFVAGAHTQYLTESHGSTIANFTVAVNDGPWGADGVHAFAHYVEAYRTGATSGGAYGIEVDTVNKGDLRQIDPFIQSSYQTIALQLAAGAELSSVGQFPSSAAINIRDNGAVFDKGLIFGDASLTRAGGTATGAATAIAFSIGHTIQWYSATGAKSSAIRSDSTTAAAGITQLFTDNQVNFNSNSNGISTFQIITSASPINHLAITATATGVAPSLSAFGFDTNVDLALNAQGTGKIQFGTYTAGVVAQAGYITVKDSGGTVRRLLVG